MAARLRLRGFNTSAGAWHWQSGSSCQPLAAGWRAATMAGSGALPLRAAEDVMCRTRLLARLRFRCRATVARAVGSIYTRDYAVPSITSRQLWRPIHGTHAARTSIVTRRASSYLTDNSK